MLGSEKDGDNHEHADGPWAGNGAGVSLWNDTANNWVKDETWGTSARKGQEGKGSVRDAEKECTQGAREDTGKVSSAQRHEARLQGVHASDN